MKRVPASAGRVTDQFAPVLFIKLLSTPIVQAPTARWSEAELAVAGEVALKSIAEALKTIKLFDISGFTMSVYSPERETSVASPLDTYLHVQLKIHVGKMPSWPRSPSSSRAAFTA